MNQEFAEALMATPKKKTSQDRTAQLAVFRVVPLVPQEDAALGARVRLGFVRVCATPLRYIAWKSALL